MQIKAGGSDSSVIREGSLKNLNLNSDGANTVLLYCQGSVGMLYVNEEFVTNLDLSGNINAGSVSIGTGFYFGDEITGYSTDYKEFNVWTIPSSTLTFPFIDPFNYGLRSEWEIIVGEPMIIDGMVGRTSGEFKFSIGDESLSDYTIEFDYSVVNDCANCVSIELLIGTKIKYYLVGGDIGGVNSKLDVLDDNKWSNLLSNQLTSNEGHIELQISGNEFNLLIDSVASEPVIFDSVNIKHGPIIITLDNGAFIDNFSLNSP